MARRFKCEGEKWEVRDLISTTGAAAVPKPQLLYKKAEFRCVSDSTKEPISANVPNRNLNEISDVKLCDVLREAREEGKD